MSTPGMPALTQYSSFRRTSASGFNCSNWATRESRRLFSGGRGRNRRQAFGQQPCRLAHLRHQVLGDRCSLGWRGQIQRGQRGTLLLFHGRRQRASSGCSYARLLDQAAQAQQAHADAALDGSQRFPQTLRQFGVSQAAEKCQFHHLALFRG